MILNQRAPDTYTMQMKNVEDVYPLSPMQEVMLLYMLSRTHADVLYSQFCYELGGDLNVAAFRQAWQQIVDRHPVLRTVFVWENLKQPLQIVRRHVELPFQQLDWRGLPTHEQHAKLEALRHEDRQRGFLPFQAPLMRLILIQLTPETYCVIWSTHHLLLDRWCLTLMLDELFTFYRANCQAQVARLDHPRPFRDYIAWIQQQDRSQAELFWRQTLKGLAGSTPVTVSAEASGRMHEDPGLATQHTAFSETQTEALRTFARQQGVTLSTVFQGMWALLLNHYTGRQDIVFGATVAGRPPDLAGVDAIVGSLINNLPVRIELPGDASLSTWFKQIQAAQQKRSPFEYVSLADIHAWCDVPPTQPLFDHLLVWLAPVDGRQPEGLTVRELPGDLTTAYPLTLAIAEDRQRIVVQASWDARRRTVVAIPDMLKQLETLLDLVLTTDPGCRLAQLTGF